MSKRKANKGTIVISEDPLHPKVAVLHLHGEIDESNFAELQKVLEPLYDEDHLEVIALDVENLSFMNSRVIGYLVAAFLELEKLNKALFLAKANDYIEKVIAEVGIGNLIKSVGELEELLEHIDE